MHDSKIQAETARDSSIDSSIERKDILSLVKNIKFYKNRLQRKAGRARPFGWGCSKTPRFIFVSSSEHGYPDTELIRSVIIEAYTRSYPMPVVIAGVIAASGGKNAALRRSASLAQTQVWRVFKALVKRILQLPALSE